MFLKVLETILHSAEDEAIDEAVAALQNPASTIVGMLGPTLAEDFAQLLADFKVASTVNPPVALTSAP